MKLRDYLNEEGIKLNVFAKKVGVSIATLHNILDGYDTRLSIGIRIQNATRGNVRVQELLPTKSRPSRTKKDQSSHHPAS